MPRKKSGVYVCTKSFMCQVDGKRYSVPVHAIVPRDVGYEVMEGREDCFEEIVEQATAAPGEKRAVSVPKPTKPAKTTTPAKQEDSK